jgi:hypothetical protein
VKFYEVVNQTLTLLRREGRVSYRALKVEFDLDDEVLAALKDELIEAKRLAVDEEGKVLVWAGEGAKQETEKRRSGETEKVVLGLRTSDPGRWTPPHLADQIRAEETAMAARGTAEGERKTVTHVFADLKGSTALIEGLDPEEARAIIDPALQIMMAA